MPRPTKCRRVCYFPEVLEFFPPGAVSGEPIVLTIKALHKRLFSPLCLPYRWQIQKNFAGKQALCFRKAPTQKNFRADKILSRYSGGCGGSIAS